MTLSVVVTTPCGVPSLYYATTRAELQLQVEETLRIPIAQQALTVNGVKVSRRQRYDNR